MDILGLTGFNKSNSTEKLVAVFGNNIYVWNGSAFIGQSQMVTVDSKAEFATLLDYLFFVNYSDYTRSYDGSNWSSTVNVTSAPKAKYIANWQTRLYLGYCNVGGTAYPSRVYFSDLPDSSSIAWDTTEATGNWLDVRTDDGDIIKGLLPFGDRLLIFKEHSLHRFDSVSLHEVPGALGTTSQRSIQTIDGLVYYFNSRGVYRYDGVSSQLISRPVEDYVLGVPAANLDDVCAYRDGDNYVLFLGTITNTDAELSETNAYICYDTAVQGWTHGNFNHTFTVFGTLLESGDKVIYGGTNASKVMKMESGNNDDGAGIELVVHGKPIFLEAPEAIKFLQRVFAFTAQGKEMSLQIRNINDDGYDNWADVGQLNQIVTELFAPQDSRARGFEWRVIEASQALTPRLEGLVFTYTVEGLD